MDPVGVVLTAVLAGGAIAADALLTPRIRSRRWRERVINVSCGLSRYAVHGLVHGAFLGLYAAVLAISPLALSASSPATWLFSFLAFDFLVFVTHYLSHRVRLLSAIHSVHHQPVEIDVTVGLRTHVLTSLFYLPLLLPLAALGVPLEVFLPLGALRLAAMALTHTRLRTPRWLDPFLNTPELHAVHHSADVRHYDKNIGGILMLWDHLFGTYLPREPVARCGLPGPEASSALEANWLPLRRSRDEMPTGFKSSWAAKTHRVANGCGIAMLGFLTGCLAHNARISVAPDAALDLIDRDSRMIAVEIAGEVAAKFEFVEGKLELPLTLWDGSTVLASFKRYQSTPMTFDQSLALVRNRMRTELTFVLWDYEDAHETELTRQIRSQIETSIASTLPGLKATVEIASARRIRP